VREKNSKFAIGHLVYVFMAGRIADWLFSVGTILNRIALSKIANPVVEYIPVNVINVLRLVAMIDKKNNSMVEIFFAVYVNSSVAFIVNPSLFFNRSSGSFISLSNY
jgi:hypothetical protein